MLTSLRLAGLATCMVLLAVSCSLKVPIRTPATQVPSIADQGKTVLLRFDSKSVCNFEAYAQTYSPGPFPCLSPNGSAEAPKLLNWNNGDSVIIQGTYNTDGHGQLSVSALQIVDSAP